MFQIHQMHVCIQCVRNSIQVWMKVTSYNSVSNRIAILKEVYLSFKLTKMKFLNYSESLFIEKMGNLIFCLQKYKYILENSGVFKES